MKLLACSVMMFSAMGVNAQGLDRSFPQQAQYCESSSNTLQNNMGIELRTINDSSMASKTASQGIIVRDVSNRIIVWGLLPQKWKGMCVVGASGSLEKIWLLTEPQAIEQAIKASEEKKRKAKHEY